MNRIEFETQTSPWQGPRPEVMDGVLVECTGKVVEYVPPDAIGCDLWRPQYCYHLYGDEHYWSDRIYPSHYRVTLYFNAVALPKRASDGVVTVTPQKLKVDYQLIEDTTDCLDAAELWRLQDNMESEALRRVVEDAKRASAQRREP